MNFLEFSISYLRLYESVFVGAFHGLLFSVPLSAPVLLCVRHFVHDGFKKGSIAFLGSIVGHTSFVILMCFGVRPVIQMWYALEPVLAVLGMSLALRRGTYFYNESGVALSGVKSSSISNSNLTSSWGIPNKNIFVFQFVLMFLNPQVPATFSRMLLSEDLLDSLAWPILKGGLASSFFLCKEGGLSSSPTGLVCVGASVSREMVLSNAGYIVAFGVCSFVLIAGVSTVVRSMSEGRVSFVKEESLGLLRGLCRKVSVALERKKVNELLVYGIIGCVLQGSIHYTWRLLTHYPLEFVPSVESVSGPLGGLCSPREFTSFDSNIRHREKNLPVERHLPIERMNARRSLSGRPAFSEEQKSSAYVKYTSFFLNSIEKYIENSKIRVQDRVAGRLGGASALEKLRKRYSSARSSDVTGESGQRVGPLELSEHTTKGKPKFSYIRTLFAAEGVNRGERRGKEFLHDDLGVYDAVFVKLISGVAAGELSSDFRTCT